MATEIAPGPGTPRTAVAWHALGAPDALASLGSSLRGLPEAMAAERLAQHGRNELVDRGSKHPLAILWEQLTAVMVLILVAASVLSLSLGKYLEAGAILAIVVLFAFLGFFQEYRAERAMLALKRLSVPTVRVLRDGTVVVVAATELVPGDVVLLEAGNLLPADVRFVETVNLRVQEAALTGESEPVEKDAALILASGASLGDRSNLGFMGTLVTYGRGTAVVVATGMSTELGRIAELLQQVSSEATPLQRRLDGVGKQLALGGVVVAVLVAGIGVLLGEKLGEMVLSAISVAVAVIPEGLPAVVTVTLALGAQRMLRRNALIRKLPAVETLGSVTTICSDKTGTLTQNLMTVTTVDVGTARLALGAGTSDLDAAPGAVRLALAGSALCNDAQVRPTDDEVVGDPTETALVVAARRAGFAKAELDRAMPREAELPFDSTRKRMTTVHRRPGTGDGGVPELWAERGLAGDAALVAVTKGATDSVLDVSSHLWVDGRAEPLDEDRRDQVMAATAELARQGMRVLAVAFRPLEAVGDPAELERELVFVGVSGMIDPPRPEVRAAVARSRDAGIRVMMITGDHPLTASAIARELGITANERVVTGAELARLDDAQLAETVRGVAVFARVSPEHKLRIVDSLQAQGEVVAMTGDGVNDAPALKRANIGVAMGITGTDVSKEASDMVLRDDNFATIVAAVEEGRVIYDNLRRFVKFVVAGNIGKVLVMLLWPLTFLLSSEPLVTAVALLPLQLLWLNLLTDGLLGLGMGFERAERDVMSRPPHSPSAGIFSGGVGWQALWVGAYIGAVSLAVGVLYVLAGRAEWQTMLFATLAFLQLFQAFGTRSMRDSLATQGLFSNQPLAGIAVAVVVLQLVALYSPLASFLGLMVLSVVDLGISFLIGASLLVALELEKVWRRARSSLA
ncbi:MAG: cation-translocating P-type ATPase [Polyangiaceae bacterium]|nr:cation-translocating P-type ATPase [Polyangiaceae bacterium]